MKALLQTIKKDLKKHGGRGVTHSIIVLLFNTSFHLLLNYRLGRFLHERRNPLNSLLILFLKRRQLVRYSCDISYQALIGQRVHFPHPIGIVVGVGVEIQDDVMIWQGVTLGAQGKSSELTKSYPVIKKGVKLFTNCKVLGAVEVGEYAIVAASALVNKNVPKGHLAIGLPAIVKPL